jgi:hypothetical protein
MIVFLWHDFDDAGFHKCAAAAAAARVSLDLRTHLRPASATACTER